MKKICLLFIIIISILCITVKADEESGIIIENNTISYNGKIAKFSVNNDILELEYEGCVYEKRRGNSYEAIAVNEECSKEDSTFDWETLNVMFDELDNKLLINDVVHKEEDNNNIKKFMLLFIPIFVVTALIVAFIFLKESYRR